MPKLLKILGFIILCELVGVIGAFFTFESIPTWYVNLSKPFFSPPNWVFGPVWTALYAMMGIAGYLIWENKSVKPAKGWFVVQLGLNFIWTPVFFGAKDLFTALIVILCLWFAIFQTIRSVYRKNQVIAILLLPYLLWVSFATLLNLSLYFLN